MNLPNPGTELVSLTSFALAGGFFTTRATWEIPDFEVNYLHSLSQFSYLQNGNRMSTCVLRAFVKKNQVKCLAQSLWQIVSTQQGLPRWRRGKEFPSQEDPLEEEMATHS